MLNKFKAWWASEDSDALVGASACLMFLIIGIYVGYLIGVSI